MENKPKDLRLNEWLEAEMFSYQLFYPYEEGFNPEVCTIDVFVKKENKGYVGTFITLQELRRWFNQFKENGDYSSGTYIPLNRKEILLERIEEKKIEKTIEDLVTKGEFNHFFEKAETP